MALSTAGTASIAPSVVRNGAHHYSTNVAVGAGTTGTHQPQPYVIHSTNPGNGAVPVVVDATGSPVGYQIMPSRAASQVGYTENLTAM